MWTNTSKDRTSRASVRSQEAEQRLRAKRRASPEAKAVAKTFGVTLPEARRIIAAARKHH